MKHQPATILEMTKEINRRAEAYPRLVAQLQAIIKTWEGPRERAAIQFAQQMNGANAILRELGETD